MTSRERIEKAWNFEEPDRVPFELYIMKEAAENPLCDRLKALIERHADNWSCWGPSWGWFGMDYQEEREVIEERVGEYRRERWTRRTPAGDFVQVTYHPASTSDYHYEKHFISTLEDLERLTHAPRRAVAWGGFDRGRYGDRFVTTHVPHPFGELARNADQTAFYTWFITEPERLHGFFRAYTDHVVKELGLIGGFDAPRYFTQLGLEMAIDPWLSPAMLGAFVAPYDARINRQVHACGGKVRHHCHGKVMNYFETFSRMGLDGTEPCEPPPQADVDLRRAKRLVGDRMLLCGNIPSPQFQTMDPAETRQRVRQAIRDAARGGGFVLRPTGGDAGTWETRNLPRVVANCEAMIEAALEFGEYPIRA